MNRTVTGLGASIAMAVVGCAALILATPALGQSASSETTRTTTTVERSDGVTTTTTWTNTRSASVDIDGEAVIDALFGQPAPSRPTPPAGRQDRIGPEEVFGVWWADSRMGGRDCRLDFGSRGFMGVRSVTARDCPREMSRISNWTVERDRVVLFRGSDDRYGELWLVDGRLVGAGLLLRREDDDRDDHGWREPSGGEDWGDRRARREEGYAGEWRHTETTVTGQRRECRVRLTTDSAFGRLRGSSTGCFGTLMGVSSWGLEDNRVVLYRAGGTTIIELRGNRGRLTGRTANGDEIVLYR